MWIAAGAEGYHITLGYDLHQEGHTFIPAAANHIPSPFSIKEAWILIQV